ncbi:MULTISPECIES: TniQ family protein [Rhizobium]|uniref:TniQ family protein n=1 Tax=Rhizobium phaseoli TaxID=396 RepID=A0A7X6F593_9HYPH|nr:MULTISPECIES: TniQ family protein [Rhizobium]MDE8762013.1 TniQ family protein [Rhizobium sp. CBK13]NKF13566.1 TniQ family protein [Rhizobium phaseoli]QPK06999.1 TniQ family protein [Rhizobium phaseoli]
MTGLFKVPLLLDEPFTSYLSRLAQANGAPNVRVFCRDMGLNRSALNGGDAEEIARLAKLLHIPCEELLNRAIVVDAAGGAVFAGSVFPKRMLRRSKLRFCPRCILDDDNDESRMPGARRYARLHWMFPQVPSCPVHSCSIVETDDDPRFRYDIITQLSLIENRLPEMFNASTDRLPTSFEGYVRDRLAGFRKHGDFLDDLSLAVGMSSCELFGVTQVYGREAKAGQLSDEDMGIARNAGFESLAVGTAGFRSLLDSIRSTDQRANYRGGQALYGKLYLSLNENYEHPEYDRLRSQIRSYTLEQVPVLNGVEFFGRVTDSPWTSVGAIAEATGYADQTLRRILVGLGHIDALRQSKGDRFVKATAAEDAIVRIRDMATREEAAAILGLPATTVKRIVSDGMIAPIFKDDGVGGRDYRLLDRYSRSEVASLRDSLLKHALTSFPSEWINLTEAARKVGLRLVDVIAMVLDGRLRHLGKTADEDGVAGLRFDWQEIESLIGAPTEVFVERAEVCRRLSLQAEAFAFLVRSGHLKAQQRQLRVARAPTWVMTEKDFNKFDARYVTFARLSRETGIGTRGIGNRLRERDLPLAFPMESVKQGIVERSYLPL